MRFNPAAGMHAGSAASTSSISGDPIGRAGMEASAGAVAFEGEEEKEKEQALPQGRQEDGSADWDLWWRIAAGLPVLRLDAYPELALAGRPNLLRTWARLQAQRRLAGMRAESSGAAGGVLGGIVQQVLGRQQGLVGVGAARGAGAGLFGALRAVVRGGRMAVRGGIGALCDVTGVDGELVQHVAVVLLVIVSLAW